MNSHLVQMFSFTGDTVLDPFCGTGTTMVAALKHGRNSLGVELDPAYCQQAASRLLHETPRRDAAGFALIPIPGGAESVLAQGRCRLGFALIPIPGGAEYADAQGVGVLGFALIPIPGGADSGFGARGRRMRFALIPIPGGADFDWAKSGDDCALP